MAKKSNRTRKAAINSITSISGQLISMICGFILPRLILARFGSAYNGITTSISQFISCVVLLRAGIGGVTRAALYKPLAEENNEEISGIVNATELFMRKIALIFVGGLLIFAFVYPFAVKNEFEYIFSFTLVLILGINTFAQNYFGITYKILITADQKNYVASLIQIITTILNTIVASVLILMGFSIHIVKLGSALVFSLNPVVLHLYVKKKYLIDKNVLPNHKAISQRWDAFAQQVAAFVNNNTDLMVLTLFTNMKEVSVYSVYYMVAGHLRTMVQTLTSGLDAGFGNLLAKNENQKLHKAFSQMEQLMFMVATFVFICGIILIEPFVMIYTAGITDVNYSRAMFGMLMCINQFFFCVRLPYQMLVEAAGHFKQTRNGAIFESVMNIVISVGLVVKFGLIGVAIGTFFALVFRTGQYAIYSSDHLLKRSKKIVVKRVLVSIAEASLIYWIAQSILRETEMTINTYLSWIAFGFITASVAAAITILGSLLFYKDDTIGLLKRVRGIFRK